MIGVNIQKRVLRILIFFNSENEQIGCDAITPPTQKTVVDAVEWMKAGNEIAAYKIKELTTLVYCVAYDNYHFVSQFSDAGKGVSKHYQVICTRAEFEAYVKELPNFKATRENLEKIAKDAQGDFVEVEEGEKWTHIDNIDDGVECRWLVDEPDIEGMVPIQYKDGIYSLAHAKSLKPIKPTISEDAVSKLRAYANWTAGQESGYVSELIEEFIATHDII